MVVVISNKLVLMRAGCGVIPAAFFVWGRVSDPPGDSRNIHFVI